MKKEEFFMKKETLINLLLTTEEPTEEKLKKINESYQALSEEEKMQLQQQTLFYAYDIVKNMSPYQEGKINSSMTPIAQSMETNLAIITEKAISTHTTLEFFPTLHTATILATQTEIKQIDMVQSPENVELFGLSQVDQITMEMIKIDLTQQKETLDLVASNAKSAQIVTKAADDYSEGKITLEEYINIIKIEHVKQQYLGEKHQLSQLKAKKEKTLLQYGLQHAISSRAPVMPEQELVQLNTAIANQEEQTAIYQTQLQALQGLLPEEETKQPIESTLDAIFSIKPNQLVEQLPKTYTFKK